MKSNLRISANFSPSEVRVLRQAMDAFSNTIMQTDLFRKGTNEDTAAYFRLRTKIEVWNTRLKTGTKGDKK